MQLGFIGAAIGLVALGFAAGATSGALAQTTPASSFTGTWSGEVDQPGHEAPFAISITIAASGATTSYPDQGCTGTLTRIGANGVYVFYVEKITKNRYDATKGTGCLDGTITLAKAGNAVLMSWFGTVDNGLYQASATLTKK
jgi:hypothetical protein